MTPPPVKIHRAACNPTFDDYLDMCSPKVATFLPADIKSGDSLDSGRNQYSCEVQRGERKRAYTPQNSIEYSLNLCQRVWSRCRNKNGMNIVLTWKLARPNLCHKDPAPQVGIKQPCWWYLQNQDIFQLVELCLGVHLVRYKSQQYCGSPIYHLQTRVSNVPSWLNVVSSPSPLVQWLLIQNTSPHWTSWRYYTLKQTLRATRMTLRPAMTKCLYYKLKRVAVLREQELCDSVNISSLGHICIGPHHDQMAVEWPCWLHGL